MATYSACTGDNVAKVAPFTGGTRQNVDHAMFLTFTATTSGDSKSQCATVRIGHNGLQN